MLAGPVSKSSPFSAVTSKQFPLDGFTPFVHPKLPLTGAGARPPIASMILAVKVREHNFLREK